MAEEDGILVAEGPCGSHLYRPSLALREAILRQPLGLTLDEEDRADDALRQHFCGARLLAQGEPFDENTVPHIRMTKRLA